VRASTLVITLPFIRKSGVESSGQKSLDANTPRPSLRARAPKNNVGVPFVSIKDVIRAKADFIQYMEIDIAHTLSCVRRMQAEADAIMSKPKLGCRQRYRADELYRETERVMERLYNRLGSKVFETYRFVEDNQKHLTKKVAKKLFQEET
jgi:hypothetical protein